MSDHVRVYISYNIDEVATGEVTTEIYEQAEQYQAQLQEDTTDWNGTYERKLPSIAVNDGTDVFLRVTEDEWQFGIYSYEGFESSWFDYEDITLSSEVRIDRMIPYYVNDQVSDLTSERVVELLADQDVQVWEELIEEID